MGTHTFYGNNRKYFLLRLLLSVRAPTLKLTGIYMTYHNNGNMRFFFVIHAHCSLSAVFIEGEFWAHLAIPVVCFLGSQVLAKLGGRRQDGYFGKMKNTV